MEKAAVILTVFNRKDITLQGLRSLYRAIKVLGDGYSFDIYMTDDGCTDGTGEAVHKEFPQIHIIKGDGSLYWSGGMRKAWQAAINSGIDYDYYLWFNDDVELCDDSLQTMFNAIRQKGPNCIISGAFCDHNRRVSYGGKTENEEIIEPNGECQVVRRMNGNLVLIPKIVSKSIGIIDKKYKHGLGDYDYGCRAQLKGFIVLLTPKYVGIVDRHDVPTKDYFMKKYPFRKRWNQLYSPKESPFILFYFERKYCGIYKAIKTFVWLNLHAIFPKY